MRAVAGEEPRFDRIFVFHLAARPLTQCHTHLSRRFFQTASWQLALSKYRFGGRQPRLGGFFVGEKNCSLNKEGFKEVCKLNAKALFLVKDLGPCG